MSRRPHREATIDRRRSSRWPALAVAAAVSVLVHVQLLTLLGLIPPPDPPKVSPRPSQVSVRAFAIPSRQWRKLQRRVLPRRSRPTPKRELAVKKKPKRIKGQVVEVEPNGRKPPKDARFLAEHDSRVKKETLSRHRRASNLPFRRKVTRNRSKRPKRARLVSRSLTVYNPKPGGNRGKTKKAAPKLAVPRIKRSRRLALEMSRHGAFANSLRRDPLRGRGRSLVVALRPTRTKGSGKKHDRSGKGPGIPVPNILSLRPNFGTLSRIAGAPTPDHHPDVAEGEETLLNAREWKYATFLNRVKRGVAQHWRPGVYLRRRDPYGNVYGFRDRVTVLVVTLTREGKVKGLLVRRSSGLRFLDRVAIRAFEQAQPFANPPPGLVGSDGLIRFKFGFYVELSMRARFRIFRFGS